MSDVFHPAMCRCRAQQCFFLPLSYQLIVALACRQQSGLTDDLMNRERERECVYERESERQQTYCEAVG